MYYSKYKFDLILLRGVDFFSVALTVTVLGGFDVLLLLNSVVERRKQQFCGVQVLQMVYVTFYFFLRV